MATESELREEWPLRPWYLAGLLALAGLGIHFASGGRGPDTGVPWRAALSALLFFGPMAFAFTADRDRWKGPLAFAAVVGLVMAGLAWRAVGGGDSYATPHFAFIAGLIATGIAVPLFQSGFHRTRFDTPYAQIHGHAWRDAIGAAGALAFTGASWLLLLVLSELFHLLRIDVLRDLMREGWFGWTWSGAAFGAALGVLRNEARIIGTLQRVVMVIMSILGVPLALALVVFLVAMAVSGPDVLWSATRSATPVLLTCAAGAWLIANAIIRDTDAEMSGNRALRAAGMVLVLVVLPLTAFAAFSLGTRVAQHGLSPERLWGLIAIAVACAYGLAWFVAVVRGWRGGAWLDRVRQANLHLAAVVCVVALVLSLPLVDFGAISARNQVARLESGAVSAEDFDYAALRWDFGDAGRRALRALAESKDGAIASKAREALALAARPYPSFDRSTVPDFRLRMQVPDAALERAIRRYLQANPWMCPDFCVAVDTGTAGGARSVALVTPTGVQLARFRTSDLVPFPPDPVAAPPAVAELENARVELRTRPMRQIYVNGRAVGGPFE
ncbi:DUF4153 domain-containing protein [Altererythrobacter aerius]|uniref:DUF4153 domain-containing protein n=1 Tax=Tsuneonella aeria TaxID=1837929 RepID=A0A6I4TER6_9SPHN|nr:DUF4153 domain-containing protein [Tsuneonella aeria]MXO74640.1 DUF4153 domain-containing protein [Tsuneonella aeria]